MTAPYLTDKVSLDLDLTGADFCVALAIDGTTPQANFNLWVDKAYKKCPLFAVVKPNPYQYHEFTLGKWPPVESDPAYKWMRSHFVAPDGKTKYAIAGVLVDMRSYYDPTGNPYSGNWITETAKHWRSWLTGWGFKTFLFIGPQIESLYPDNAQSPAVYIQTEQNPVAVYETDPKVICTWPLSKFLKRTGIDTWESIIPIDALYKMIGWTAAPTPEPVTPPAELTDSQKIDFIYRLVKKLTG